MNLYHFNSGIWSKCSNLPETIISANRPELPRVLIYGDSFTNALECLFYYRCDELHSIDFRYYKENSLVEYIKEYEPDIVICVRDYESLISFDGNEKMQ